MKKMILAVFAAAIFFSDSAVADTNWAIEYNNRGLAYHNKGDYDSAISYYTSVIELDPKYLNAYYNRGTGCHSMSGW